MIPSMKTKPLSTARSLNSVYAFQKSTEAKYCDMHQPLEFTPEELQRMDDDRSDREVYRMEDARDDNSNPPEVE